MSRAEAGTDAAGALELPSLLLALRMGLAVAGGSRSAALAARTLGGDLGSRTPSVSRGQRAAAGSCSRSVGGTTEALEAGSRCSARSRTDRASRERTLKLGHVAVGTSAAAARGVGGCETMALVVDGDRARSSFGSRSSSRRNRPRSPSLPCLRHHPSVLAAVLPLLLQAAARSGRDSFLVARSPCRAASGALAAGLAGRAPARTLAGGAAAPLSGAQRRDLEFRHDDAAGDACCHEQRLEFELPIDITMVPRSQSRRQDAGCSEAVPRQEDTEVPACVVCVRHECSGRHRCLVIRVICTRISGITPER